MSVEARQIPGESELDRKAIEELYGFMGKGRSVDITPVDMYSNLNRLYCVDADDGRYYLKIALNQPKGAMGTVPRARIFAEADAMRFAGGLCGDLVDIPDVVHESRSSYSFVMTDVGSGRRHLSDYVPDSYDVMMRAHEVLGQAIARVHRSSASGEFPIRDTYHYEDFREFIYGDVVGPGIERLGITGGAAVLKEMRSVRECLIHSDLWGKNVLVDERDRLGLIDFEGAILGDPAFDVATLMTSGLISVYQYGVPFESWRDGAERTWKAYAAGLDDAAWLSLIQRRVPRYVAVFLALRVAGPFPYELDERGRRAAACLARNLVRDEITSWTGLCDTARHAMDPGQ